MTWVDPEFDCGECGGKIARWPMKNMLKQDILDWRHKTVPPGIAPHRAVLGTPVPIEVILPVSPAEVEEEVTGPEPAPLPIVPARAAMREEMPPAALRLDKKADENGWTVRAYFMHGPYMTAAWKFSRMVKSVVMHLDRDGHRLVACWRNDTPEVDGWAAADWPGVPFVTSLSPWKFEQAYSVGHGHEPLTSPQLNAAVVVPRAVCESCGEPPALHFSTRTGPVCHSEWAAAMAAPNPEETS